MTDFSALKGLTLKEIQGDQGSERLTFITTDDREFVMFHSQDCCESVSIEDIAGDLQDLIGSEILTAEETSNTEPDAETIAARKAEYEKNHAEDGYYDSFEDYNRSYHESETWTFYKLATIKGSVTIRWYGSSNGYYSESVSFIENDGSEDARWYLR